MNFDAIEKLIRALDVSRFPVPVTLTTSGESVTAKLSVTDVHTGYPTQVYTRLPLPRNPTKVMVLRTVRLALVRAMEHEVDESLWLEGEPINDPHREKISRV